jgi:hypothetical protein
VSARQLLKRIIALRPDLAGRARMLLQLLDSIGDFPADQYAEDVEIDPEGVLRHLESMFVSSAAEAAPAPPLAVDAPDAGPEAEAEMADFGRPVRRLEPFEVRRPPLTRRIVERLRNLLPARPVVLPAPPPAPSFVSTGFADTDGGPPRPAERTLAAGRQYQFWLEVAPAPLPFSIETSPDVPLPPLDSDDVLHVVLFRFGDGLLIPSGTEVGTLRLDGRGPRRLFFPVATVLPGPSRMRVSIYCKQALLQSRVVTVEVTEEEQTLDRAAATSDLDFAVMERLDPADLAPIKPRTLSVMVNDSGDGSHDFRFFGRDNKSRSVTLTANTVGVLLDRARQGLRLASWGSPDERDPKAEPKPQYRYAEPDDDVMAEDLVELATRGFDVWVVVATALADDADALQALMRAPGRVEFANKDGVALMVPAACIYDYPLDMAEAGSFTLCPDFLANRAQGAQALQASACFQGDCPSRAKETVVCPGGFWGFRHEIGLMPSLTGKESGQHATLPTTIPARPPVFVVGASADGALEKRPAHVLELQGILGTSWTERLSRKALFQDFATHPSVVYLYGHGSVTQGMPSFEVGQGADGPITGAMLQKHAKWAADTPLVFLNGCGTAALGPDTAFAYAGAFMATAKASAVIGTEIAVFEDLAVRFGEEYLRRFVLDHAELGQAMRDTRVALLADGIPLGLAYVAFGATELHLAAGA